MPAEIMREKMDATLQEWKGKINELKGKAQQASAEKKKEFLERVQELERDHTNVFSKWQATKDKGQDAWDKMKEETSQAFDRMKEKYDKMKQP